MIELYIDNEGHPEQVENTVKDYSVEIEHADETTCITIHEECLDAIEKLGLKILHKRGK